MSPTAAIRAEIAKHRWFHAIDLGDGLVTPGRFGEEVPPNYTLYGVFEVLRQVELTGLRCVDIGTMDGITAFAMKRLGAADVIATDLAPRPTFCIARDRLGLDIDYRTPLAALDLPEALGEERADVITMAGVLYHVFDPLNVLVACRESLRREGLLVVETTYLFDEPRPIMSFNPVDMSQRGIDITNIFWRPSRSAVEGMLMLAGFEVLASIAVDARLTVVAQARRPSQVGGVTDRLRKIHASYMRYINYRERVDFDRLECDDAPPSGARYEGPRGHRRLYRALCRPAVPFQPAWDPPDAGTRLRDVLRSATIHAAAGAASVRNGVETRARQIRTGRAP